MADPLSVINPHRLSCRIPLIYFTFVIILLRLCHYAKESVGPSIFRGTISGSEDGYKEAGIL